MNKGTQAMPKGFIAAGALLIVSNPVGWAIGIAAALWALGWLLLVGV